MTNVITKQAVEDFVSLVKKIYSSMIRESGGTEGIRDDGGLYNSVWKTLREASKQRDPINLGAFIYLEFATRHHFVDGNKRTAHIIAKMFLMLNGTHLKVDYTNAKQFIMDIGAEKKSKKEIAQWIEANSETYDVKTKFQNILDAWFKEMWNKKD